MNDEDPYQNGMEVVWRDPMGYDAKEHGPPYLPVTAAQRDEGRRFARRCAAFYDTGQGLVPQGSPYEVLAHLLAGLRTLSMVHQTAHWQVRGGHFYGDHLLFARLYEESQDAIDGLAERLIGLTSDPGQVALCSQIEIMHQFVKTLGGGHSVFASPPKLAADHSQALAAPSSADLVKRSLLGEAVLIGSITHVKKALEAAGALTEGLEDLLQSIASKHEEFVYLLKQRAAACRTARTIRSYDRRR